METWLKEGKCGSCVWVFKKTRAERERGMIGRKITLFCLLFWPNKWSWASTFHFLRWWRIETVMKKDINYILSIVILLESYLQKLTMMRIPDKGICYLMPMPKELSTPDKLIGDLEKASQVTKSFCCMSALCSSHCFINWKKASADEYGH